MQRIIQTANIPTLLCRLAVGLIFLSEGMQKYFLPDAAGTGRFAKIGFGNPSFWAYFTGTFEIICGILLLIGLLTRLAAIPLLIIMIVAFITTKYSILIDKGFWSFAHEYRTDFAMTLLLIYLIIYGGGNYSVDKKITYSKTIQNEQNNNQQNELSQTQRRDFIKRGLIVSLSGAAGLSLLSGCKDKDEKEESKDGDEGQKVSPPEDLMQEHGLLNRVLLIYDTCRMHLINKEPFPKEAILNSANIIRTFVEDYHEKQEENYLFPRFQKANQLTDLVNVLLQQHQAGRRLTDEIMQLAKSQTATDTENQKLIQLLTSFNTMYRPHEAREDTILFPAFRKLVSKNEYDSLGEEFENNEHKLFGKGGFETMVSKVEAIEKSLNIYELSQFTPQV